MARPFNKERSHPVLMKFPESVYLEIKKEAEAVGLPATSYCTLLVHERRKQLKAGRSNAR